VALKAKAVVFGGKEVLAVKNCIGIRIASPGDFLAFKCYYLLTIEAVHF